MMTSTFTKPLITGCTLAALIWCAGAAAPSGQTYASGGATTAPSRGFDLPQTSPQQRRIDRLYNQGRKLFRRKVSCNSGCLVADDVINDENAAGFLLAMHNQERFQEALNERELQAVSVYMLRRFDIKIE